MPPVPRWRIRLIDGCMLWVRRERRLNARDAVTVRPGGARGRGGRCHEIISRTEHDREGVARTQEEARDVGARWRYGAATWPAAFVT